MGNVKAIKECELVLKNRLKEIRKKRGLTQKQLAEVINVSRQTISAIETGYSIPTARLALIKNFNLYAQAERNGRNGVIPNTAQLEFAQRYVYGKCYKKENWREYCQKRGFDF